MIHTFILGDPIKKQKKTENHTYADAEQAVLDLFYKDSESALTFDKVQEESKASNVKDDLR